MKRLPVLLAIAGIGFWIVFAASVPVSASVTRYFVHCAGDSWTDTNCWSATSGGAGGASVPGSTDTAIVDANSGSVSYIHVATSSSIGTLTFNNPSNTKELDLLSGATFTVGTITYINSAANYDIYISGDGSSAHFHFIGTIQGDTGFARLRFLTTTTHGDFQYTGSNAFGTMSYSYVQKMDASGGAGKPIYCYPGCTDGGNNINIFFTNPIMPPSVSTVAASSITCGIATLNGNLTSMGSSATVTRGFLFGTSPVLSGASNLTVDTVNATGTFSLNVTGLEQGVFYYFRAWANGTDGYAQGAILFFQSAVCPTICGADPYSAPNVWTVGFLIGLAVVLAFIAVIRFPPLWVLSGIAILFISFYSFCMAGLVPAGLSVVVGIFAILQGIPAKDFEGQE